MQGQLFTQDFLTRGVTETPPYQALTAQRLKSLAQSRGLSMNKLVEQLSAHALSARDTENHFRAMAATGDVQTALAVLDRLDAADGEASAH